MNISNHLANHAVSELLQMGYKVDGDTLTPPEKLSEFACKFFGVAPAAGAAPTDAEGTIAGWKSHAEAMERERDYYRQRVRTMHEHQDGAVWYWQNDGEDHPESMVGSLPVVIRADQLRALLAAAPAQEAEEKPDEVDEAWAQFEADAKKGGV